MPGEPLSIGVALSQAIKQLDRFDNPRLEAETLLSHVTGQNRTYFRTWPEKTLSDEQHEQFQHLVARRLNGEPVAYLTGFQDFWSLNLKVTPDTLVPRGDTELLVEQALERIPSDQTWHIADLGTGSGAIALSLALERPRCHVVATDINPDTLAIAKHNAQANQLSNVDFKLSNWLKELGAQQFELIASNPPYIAEDDPHLNGDSLPHEPHGALTPGGDGLSALRTIIDQARQHLCSPGWLLLEHGYDQGDAVQHLLRESGYRDVQTYLDLGGNPRMSCGRYDGQHEEKGKTDD